MIIDWIIVWLLFTIVLGLCSIDICLREIRGLLKGRK